MVIGILGLIVQQIFVQHLTHFHVMDVGIQFIGAEVIKSSILLIFSKKFHNFS